MLLSLRADQAHSEHRQVFLYRRPGASTAVPFRKCYESWKAALRNAGVDPTTRIHDLRHTFASRLVSKGVPIFDVSKLLGHKSINMTMRYAHLAPEAFESAIANWNVKPIPMRGAVKASLQFYGLRNETISLCLE